MARTKKRSKKRSNKKIPISWLVNLLSLGFVSYGVSLLVLSRRQSTNFRELMPHAYDTIPDLNSLLKGAPGSTTSSSHSKLPRVLAIFFPQYHQDALNDKNWGVNFTDWDSLRSAPLKNRHGLPIPRPTDLGYYDLTDFETRRRQSQLAKRYGIDGFIYHHYWFYDPSHPGPNLAIPLLNMLKDGEPNMPFFFNWCAVKWVNVWMGKAIFQTIPTNRNRAITLQEQYFNATDTMILEHYKWLSPFFHNTNYIKIDNQPVFLIYSYDELARPILEKLRKYARNDGFDGIHLIVGRSAAPVGLFVPYNLTDDEFKRMEKISQPVDLYPMDFFNQSMTYPYPLQYVKSTYVLPEWCLARPENGNFNTSSKQARPEVTGVITAFDNTPRREFEHSRIFLPDQPGNITRRFQKNLHIAVYYQTCCMQQTNDRFVAVNAWNEWAEGMSIEPSDVYGHKFLEIIRDVKAQILKEGCSATTRQSIEGW